MKVAVTGANKGIGHAIVLRLLADPKVSQVYFTSRDEKVGAEALKDFNAVSKGKKVDFLPLDILAENSVDKFVKETKEKNIQFDAFVNNAGVFMEGMKKEVLDTQFRVNYTFPVELTRALIKAEIVRKGGRFVYTSSGIGNIEQVRQIPDIFETVKNYKNPEFTEKVVEDLAKRYQAEVMDPSKGWSDNLYAQSKLFLTLHVNAFSKTYKDYFFISTCPGFVNTPMTQGMGATRTPDEGAKSASFVATTPDVAELNGNFFKEMKLKSIV